MARDQQSHALEVCGLEGLPDRPLEVASTLQPRARPSAQRRHEIGPAAPELVEQQLGEEMMVTVPLALLVQGYHEQVGAGELAQEPGGTLPTRHRVAKGTRKAPQYRGLGQKLPHFLGET